MKGCTEFIKDSLKQKSSEEGETIAYVSALLWFLSTAADGQTSR